MSPGRLVRRIFEETRDGRDSIRIAKQLNAEASPSTVQWTPTGVREILRRDLYRAP